MLPRTQKQHSRHASSLCRQHYSDIIEDSLSCRDDEALADAETIHAPPPSKAELTKLQGDADLALLFKATKRVVPRKEKPVVPELPVSAELKTDGSGLQKCYALHRMHRCFHA
jgi:hypothetical protein